MNSNKRIACLTGLILCWTWPGLAESNSGTRLDDLPTEVASSVRLETRDGSIAEIGPSSNRALESWYVDWEIDGFVIRTAFDHDGGVIERTVLSDSGILRARENDVDDDEADEDEDGTEENEFVTELVEWQTSMSLLPPSVRQAIEREAGSHPLAEIEWIITDRGIFYDAEWVVDGDEIGVLVSPDGGVVHREQERPSGGTRN